MMKNIEKKNFQQNQPIGWSDTLLIVRTEGYVQQILFSFFLLVGRTIPRKKTMNTDEHEAINGDPQLHRVIEEDDEEDKDYLVLSYPFKSGAEPEVPSTFGRADRRFQ